MPAYTWKNGVLDVPQFWMCLMQYLVFINWAVIETETYSVHRLTFKMKRRYILCAGALRHIDKFFVKNTRKQRRRREAILLDPLKIIFWMKNLTQKWTQSGPLFQYYGTFLIFKKGQGRPSPLSPGCAFMSLVEYVSKSLNIPKYLWECLNKLFWLSCGSELPDHLTCSTNFWRCLGF